MVWVRLQNICKIEGPEKEEFFLDDFKKVPRTDSAVYQVYGSTKSQLSTRYNRYGKYLVKLPSEELTFLDGKFLLVNSLSLKFDERYVDIKYIKVLMSLIIKKDIKPSKLKTLSIDLPNLSDQGVIFQRLLNKDAENLEREIFEAEQRLNSSFFVPEKFKYMSSSKFSDYFEVIRAIDLEPINISENDKTIYKKLCHNPDKVQISKDYNYEGEALIFDMVYKIPEGIDKNNLYNSYKNKIFQIGQGRFKVEKSTALIVAKTDNFSVRQLFDIIKPQEFFDYFYTFVIEKKIKAINNLNGDKINCIKLTICLDDLLNSRIFMIKNREEIEKKLFANKKRLEMLKNTDNFFNFRFKKKFLGIF